VGLVCYTTFVLILPSSVIIIIKNIYIAQVHRVAVQLRNGAAHPLKQLRGVEQINQLTITITIEICIAWLYSAVRGRLTVLHTVKHKNRTVKNRTTVTTKQ